MNDTEYASKLNARFGKLDNRWGKSELFRAKPDSSTRFVSALSAAANWSDLQYLAWSLSEKPELEGTFHAIAVTDELIVEGSYLAPHGIEVRVIPRSAIEGIKIHEWPDVLSNSTENSSRITLTLSTSQGDLHLSADKGTSPESFAELRALYPDLIRDLTDI